MEAVLAGLITAVAITAVLPRQIGCSNISSTDYISQEIETVKQNVQIETQTVKQVDVSTEDQVVKRRQKLTDSGVDIDKLSRLMREVQVESRKDRVWERALILLLQVLMFMVVMLLASLAYSKSELSLKDYFPNEHRILFG